ncbi:hypothetical protein [Streptomyces chromofuscus]|uniref:hypothetical protein n=1 Tax=Streptomyces chromofuscus TaxID=42881 RepID=UPI00167BE031|nr:hypothetical protein [Streptomyces chromofuscus]
MGIDGVGKTTLTRELAELAQSQGLRVRTVSWRSVVEGDDPPDFPRNELRRLWVQSFRANFAGATTPDGKPVELPADFEDLYARGGTEYLNGASLHGMKASGALASAWIELAANTLLHRAIVKELVSEGYLVLQESYGYKHLVKLFAFAEHLSPESAQAAHTGRSLVADYFGRILKPDVGLYVHGSPRLALTWRRQQSGIGTFETFSSAGSDADASFLELQERTGAAFAEFAEKYGWARVDMVDGPRGENRTRAVAALADTRLGQLLDLSQMGSH